MRLTITACASGSQGATRLHSDAADLIPAPGVVAILQLASCTMLEFWRTYFMTISGLQQAYSQAASCICTVLQIWHTCITAALKLTAGWLTGRSWDLHSQG